MIRLRSLFEKIRPILPDRREWGADSGYSFFGNPLVRIVASSSLVLVLASAVATHFLIVRGVGGTIVLHYNAYFGIDIVGAPAQAYFLPLMAGVFLFANLLFAARFYAGHERIAAHMLLFSSLFVAVSTGIAIAALSFINA